MHALVRLLREELGLLQQPGSYVGEVVKVMGTKKVLVKVHPEGKYGMQALIQGGFEICQIDYSAVVDVSDNVDISKLTVGKRVTLLSDSYKLEKMLPSSVCYDLSHKNAAMLISLPGRSTCLSHDGRESPR